MTTRVDSQRPRLITHTSVTEFFRDSVVDAAANQHVDANEDTLHYVVSVLVEFTRASHLFVRTEDGLALEPVADLYREYIESGSTAQRNAVLRRMGDISLFVSGAFSGHLSRRGLSTEYYMAMGGAAYDSLANQNESSRIKPLRDTFNELARKFERFVDVIAEVSDSGRIGSDTTIVKTWESWLRTGDRQSELALRRAGIFPVTASGESNAH